MNDTSIEPPAISFQNSDDAHKERRESRSLILEKRAALRKLVKRNTKCHHLQVYTEANAICKRISTSYEEGRISMLQAMDLMFETHEQIDHKHLPRDVVALNIHKQLDKLEGADKTAFGIVMANTNSSVHVRKPARIQEGERASHEIERYSESYWAEVI